MRLGQRYLQYVDDDDETRDGLAVEADTVGSGRPFTCADPTETCAVNDSELLLGCCPPGSACPLPITCINNNINTCKTCLSDAATITWYVQTPAV